MQTVMIEVTQCLSEFDLTPILHLLAGAIVPFLALWWVRKSALVALVGPAVICYIAGISLGSMFSAPPLVKDIAEGLIPLAVPLLLFGCDVRGWLRGSRKPLISFALAGFSVVVAALVTGMIFSELPHAATYVSMLTGTYTGGTPNLMSLGVALQAPHEVFLTINAADNVTGGIFLLFILGGGRALLTRVLDDVSSPAPEALETVEVVDQWSWKEAGQALALSGLIAAVSVGVVMLLFQKLEPAWIFVLLTTASLGASLSPTVRRWDSGRQVGDYLILVFCVLIGMMTTFELIMAAVGPVLLLTTCLLLTAVTLHLVLCKVFRIDVDAAIIGICASLFGPAFIPVISTRVRAHDPLISGMTSSLVGYGIGNYLGLFVHALMS